MKIGKKIDIATYHYIVLCPYYIEILTRKKKPNVIL